MLKFIRRITSPAILAIAGSLAGTANAGLIFDVTTSTTTDFDFKVTGDFSGYTPPASLTNFLYIVPMDSGGSPVTTWVPFEQTGVRPLGAIDGDTINGWVFLNQDRTDNYAFLTGDTFTVSFGGGPYDSTSVMTADYTRSQSGLTLDTTDIAYYNLYWGRDVLLASTFPAQGVPTPTTLVLMGLGLAGIGYRWHRSKPAA